MSQLAQKIATTVTTTEPPVRRGPPNRCLPLYGPGDLEDWEAIEGLRSAGHDWRAVQIHVDTLAGIDQSLPLEKFRYHWRRRCYCWPEELRR